ncbi:MAG: DNA alkylation repair protein [Bdellovibrionaceae bacterium]|nr:DNA alkylation repair protein [Pseudobdellovibrionaceae bacterium]
MKKHLVEVESALKAINPVAKPSIWKAENYVGGGRSDLIYLDLKIPDVRRTFKKGFSFFNPQHKIFKKENLETFHYIWTHSLHFEALVICLAYVKSLPFEVRKRNRSLLLGWLSKVDNWAVSDELSGIYAEFLEDDVELLAIYKKWNRSKNSWERRQSIVGLLFYSRFRKSKFLSWPQLRQFVDPLLGDEDYYVQKGVGWALRESYNWYPKEVFNYISENVLAIAPAAWTACTEKMSLREKALLKTRRRQRVKKNFK